MITRRRGRALNAAAAAAAAVEEEPVEVEVCAAADLSPREAFPAEDLDLDDLFDDFKWTLERDPSSSPPPLFDLELAELGVYDVTEREEQRREGVRHRQGSGLNKNAIAARLNRMKKKEYVSGLERKVSGLSSENSGLKAENAQLTRRVAELEGETRYLRAVLANESVLAQLLARLGGVSGMKLSSSLFQGSGASESGDHDYALPRKRAKVEEAEEEEEAAGGVCLHVDRNHVSVEFCPQCAQRASAAFKM